MTLADKISQVTADHNPSIERLAGGDLVFHWPIVDCRRQFRLRAAIADAIGIEHDMVSIQSGRSRLSLHVPAQIAQSVV